MGSQDNVAIVSASGQIGFLEQFTNKTKILEAAMSRLAPRPYVAEGYNVGSSTKMSEFMALTIDTGRSDNKVQNSHPLQKHLKAKYVRLLLITIQRARSTCSCRSLT